MRIIIWGTGHLSRMIEDYIRQDIEIIAYIDNDKTRGGGYVKTLKRRTIIMPPDNIKNITYDYCLIAVANYCAIEQQCLQELMVPEEKILRVANLSEWDIGLVKRIFDENILENPRDYTIESIKVDLGEGHALPFYQKHFKMYDRFIPYLAEITRRKEGKYIIDIGANVGDTLVAMWSNTENQFLCIEPVEEFFRLLIDNIQRLGRPERVCVEQAFITDRMDETYQAKISEKGTAVKEATTLDNTSLIPSKSVDYLIKEKGIGYGDIDLLKIDTDGFDADCIISAGELLRKGSALIYWENYVETYEQYEKYMEAYRVLERNGYSIFFIFDNYGNYLCSGGIDTINSILNYVQRVHTDCIGNTFGYFDVLTCKSEDIVSCEEAIAQYLNQYLLYRISK